MNNTDLATTLPSIRISGKTKDFIERAIKKLNTKQISKITQQEFRRLCYQGFSQYVLQEKDISEVIEVT